MSNKKVVCPQCKKNLITDSKLYTKCKPCVNANLKKMLADIKLVNNLTGNK